MVMATAKKRSPVKWASAGKNPKSKKDKARRKSYYARHNAQDSNPSKLSARYWSHKVKW
jgi:hypothetical protein